MGNAIAAQAASSERESGVNRTADDGAPLATPQQAGVSLPELKLELARLRRALTLQIALAATDDAPSSTPDTCAIGAAKLDKACMAPHEGSEECHFYRRALNCLCPQAPEQPGCSDDPVDFEDPSEDPGSDDFSNGDCDTWARLYSKKKCAERPNRKHCKALKALLDNCSFA